MLQVTSNFSVLDIDVQIQVMISGKISMKYWGC